jgi:hypothetical protein
MNLPHIQEKIAELLAPYNYIEDAPIDEILQQAIEYGFKAGVEVSIQAIPERPVSDQDYTVEYRVCREQTRHALESLITSE